MPIGKWYCVNFSKFLFFVGVPQAPLWGILGRALRLPRRQGGLQAFWEAIKKAFHYNPSRIMQIPCSKDAINGVSTIRYLHNFTTKKY